MMRLRLVLASGAVLPSLYKGQGDTHTSMLDSDVVIVLVRADGALGNEGKLAVFGDGMYRPIKYTYLPTYVGR